MGKQAATSLHRAAARGHLQVVKLLLDKGARKNVKDSQLNTPLHVACEGECQDVCIELIKRGANLDIRNKEERLPIECAPKGLKTILTRFVAEMDDDSSSATEHTHSHTQ